MPALKHQQQPDGPWARWMITGSRRTGKSWALREMALERALLGERVGYVVRLGEAPAALHALMEHARHFEPTGRDPLAWSVDSARFAIAPRPDVVTVGGGEVQVLVIDAYERAHGRRIDTLAFDDLGVERLSEQRRFVEQAIPHGLARVATARFDSEGTGEVTVRSWYSTGAP